mgnify:FL=1|tara:strand:+ start:20097 stop:20468 length:372 start_codon:yes stop_codon:yes gene_type:complete
MIKGFETITADLSNDELALVPIVIKGLITKQGKDKAITGAKICKALDLGGARLRKIINHIRVKNLLPALCSTSSGYFVATNIYEMQDYIISLKQRIKAQVEVLNALEQQTIMFGGTGQTTLFE